MITPLAGQQFWLDELEAEYGPDWEQLHGIQRAPTGEYKCIKCNDRYSSSMSQPVLGESTAFSCKAFSNRVGLRNLPHSDRSLSACIPHAVDATHQMRIIERLDAAILEGTLASCWHILGIRLLQDLSHSQALHPSEAVHFLDHLLQVRRVHSVNDGLHTNHDNCIAIVVPTAHPTGFRVQQRWISGQDDQVFIGILGHSTQRKLGHLCGQSAQEQLRKHRHFFVEQPIGSALFELPIWRTIASQLFIVRFDQCAAERTEKLGYISCLGDAVSQTSSARISRASTRELEDMPAIHTVRRHQRLRFGP